MKKRITLSFFLAAPLAAYNTGGQVPHNAQNQVVSGTVHSETGEGMPGVNVVIKNTTTGTTTDTDGRFTLAVPDAGTTLVFTFVGYSTKEVQVGAQTAFDVNLEPDLAALQEVVVIGYGSQRRADVTTAVEHLKPESFVPGAVRNAGELLRGKVAGLTISTPTGDPAAGSEILLRGITSIYGSSAPLVLIDGYTGDLNAISPNDIESVDVLKDASAAAIYGTRGKNGVIMITTKKAKGEMAPVVEYAGYVATDRMQRKSRFHDGVRRAPEDRRRRARSGKRPGRQYRLVERDHPYAGYSTITIFRCVAVRRVPVTWQTPTTRWPRACSRSRITKSSSCAWTLITTWWPTR